MTQIPRSIPSAAAIMVIATMFFGSRIASEPHFVDESAYIAQSFYADLLLDNYRNDPAWLDYAGYDLPPLPKYLIGIALRVGGYPRPAPSSTAAWYSDTSRRFVPEAALVVFWQLPALLVYNYIALQIILLYLVDTER